MSNPSSGSKSDAIASFSASTTNIIDSIAKYADAHIQETRLAIGALGLLGVGIALRSIRFATLFTRSNQIPKDFIKKGVPLRGIVKEVHTDGTIRVCHIPIFKLPFHERAQALPEKWLPIKMSSINPTIPGVYWMKLHIEKSQVWFRVLARNDDQLNCLIAQDKSGVSKKSKNSLNAMLVQKGLAKVNAFDMSLKKNKDYLSFYETITKYEKRAKKSREGVWYEPNEWDKWSNQLNIYLQRIKNFSRKLTTNT